MAQLPSAILIPTRERFLKTPLSPILTSELIQILTQYSIDRRKFLAHRRDEETIDTLLVSYINAHCANLAHRDAAYREALAGFHVVYADGQSVVWASRMLGLATPERVNAGDFILDFCRECAGKDVRLFLIGCKDGLADKAAEAWRKAVPELKIAGTAPGYFSERDETAIVEKINASGADIVIAGMSAPRQELWALRNAERLDVAAVWCVGALFEYFSGQRSRAPVWMRKTGLEWLFRLCLEPGRLWKRYLIGNMAFVLRFLRARFLRG